MIYLLGIQVAFVNLDIFLFQNPTLITAIFSVLMQRICEISFPQYLRTENSHMKKIIFPLACWLISLVGYTQNVGIGILTPAVKLHVSDTVAPVLQLSNTKSLTIGVNTRLLFQTGGFITGIIGTYATGINTSRMGFSTFASLNSSGLQERLSITDNGFVGIGTITPANRLDVNGSTSIGGSLFVEGNTGIGTSNPSVKLDVNGSIRVSGNITKTATGTASMLPYAYGKIAANGTVLGGTGNFTAIRYSAGIYRITLTGDANLYNNRNLYTVLVSPEIDLISGISSLIETGNFIEVYTFDEEPTNGRVDMSFNFLVYRSQ
jgi:hypothetical protein